MSNEEFNRMMSEFREEFRLNHVQLNVDPNKMLADIAELLEKAKRRQKGWSK